MCGHYKELGIKLKSKTLNDNAKKVAASEHKKRDKKRYNKMYKVTELCEKLKDKAAIVFDYMQNILLSNSRLRNVLLQNILALCFLHSHLPGQIIFLYIP